MFSIYDGRTSFYQWDLNRKLIVEDSSISQVHFCNRTDTCSLVCEVYEENGKRVVDVPNILLQTDWKINVYAFDRNYTKYSTAYEVVKRTKPADYVYTETDFITLEKSVGIEADRAVNERLEPVVNDINDLQFTVDNIAELVNDFNQDIGEVLADNRTQQEQIDSLETAVGQVTEDVAKQFEEQQAQIEALIANSGEYEQLAETILTEDAGEIIWTQTADGKPLSNYKDFFIYWTGKFDKAVNNQAWVCRADGGVMYFTYVFVNKQTVRSAFWWEIKELYKDEVNTIWMVNFPNSFLTSLPRDFDYSNQGLNGSNKAVSSDICFMTKPETIQKLQFGSLSDGAKMVAGSKAILFGRAR